MSGIYDDFNGKAIGGLEEKIDRFSLQIRQARIPSYLQACEVFLGKYSIVDIIPYTKIYNEDLMAKKSVFRLPELN